MNYLDKFKLNNKLAYILGGFGVIGQEVTSAFHEAGAKIIILDKRDKFKIIKSKIKKNPNIHYNYFNCANINTLEKNYKNIEKKYGTPDILINCSYPKTKDWKNNSFEKINFNSYKKNVDIHLNSYAWIAKLVADSMIKKNKKGNIIQLSSIYGLVGQDLTIYQGTKMKESMSYSVIKGGINSLTRQMASYYGKFNIRVNSICAGGVYDKKQNKKFVKKYSNKVPLSRLAKSSEIASVALFLASESSSYITGTLLTVDGGWTSI